MRKTQLTSVENWLRSHNRSSEIIELTQLIYHAVIIGKKLFVRIPFRTAAVCSKTQQKHEMFQKWDGSGFDLAGHRVLE